MTQGDKDGLVDYLKYIDNQYTQSSGDMEHFFDGIKTHVQHVLDNTTVIKGWV
jgi:hypothetical protein